MALSLATMTALSCNICQCKHGLMVRIIGRNLFRIHLHVLVVCARLFAGAGSTVRLRLREDVGSHVRGSRRHPRSAVRRLTAYS
jgi:hypothetical protein